MRPVACVTSQLIKDRFTSAPENFASGFVLCRLFFELAFRCAEFPPNGLFAENKLWRADFRCDAFLLPRRHFEEQTLPLARIFAQEIYSADFLPDLDFASKAVAQ